MSEKYDVKRFCIVSMFTAFAIILGYVEFLIPVTIPITGFKLGITNIATVYVLYALGEKECFYVTFIRILVINLLFGTVYTALFSVTGGFLSLIIMIILKKYIKTGTLFTSAIGGLVHNFAQILVASFLIESSIIFGLLPILIIVGIITGTVVGIVVNIIYNRTKKYLMKMER